MNWRHIVLTGARAAGKSTLGRAVAVALDRPFVDTDTEIAKEVGRAAGTFLAEAGEAEFRRVEERCCLAALSIPNRAVIALGGGAVLSAAVRDALAAPEILTAWLEAPVAELQRRQQAAPLRRPRLAGRSRSEEVRLLLAAREPLYRDVAQLRINTFSANVDACVARILDMM